VKRWVALGSLLIIVTLFLGCATTGLRSELILNDEYFEVAHREIQDAKESIYLIAYLFLVYDYEDAYSNRLLKDLIEAHKRGVEVKVILDYPKPEYMGEEGPKNQQVYDKLKEAGVDVRFDSAERRTHNKVLVIDREIIIVGSHNYSFDGLRYNNEASLLIRDRDKAKRMIEYFKGIE
jgi:phosphatidylserine/phosphatidylglycerophosphate/cardiolipin synthase-like enzyme